MDEEVKKHLSILYKAIESQSEQIKILREKVAKDPQELGGLAMCEDAPTDNRRYVRQKGRWVCL